MSKKTKVYAWLLATTAICSFTIVSTASAQTKSFNIKSQAANRVIPEFAKQSGLQIIANADEIRGLNTNSVKGNIDSEIALEKLLAGTGLGIKSRTGGIIIIGRINGSNDDTIVTAAQETIVVKGARKSMRDAIANKRAATGIVETVSAKEIGVLPDVTIAETLARLPGVNTTRDRGNDSQAAIRGIGPRMVLGTINGREVATSEPDRNIRWETYPSEVVSGATIYKSSEAKLISGGISGTIDLQTIRPLEYRGPEFNIRAGGVYYDGGSALPDYDGLGYRASGSWVKKLSDKFAFVVGVTAQKQKNGYENFRGWGYNDQTVRAANSTGPIVAGGPITPTPWGAASEAKFLESDRYSVSTGLQYRPSSNYELNFDLLYSKYEISEDQNQAWYGSNNWGNWAGGNTGSYTNPIVSNGDLIGATTAWSELDSIIAKYTEDKTLIVTGLNSKWRGDDWTFAVDLSYSSAERFNLWQAVKMAYWPSSTTWLLSETPMISVSSAPLSNAQNAQNGSADPGRLKDELSAIALNYSRDVSQGIINSYEVGLRYSDRTKLSTSGYNISKLPTISGGIVPSNLLSQYKFNNFNVPNMVYGNFETLSKAIYGANALDNDPKKIGYNSEVSEQVFEAFAQANYATELGSIPVNGSFGVRVVDVNSESAGDSYSGGDWFQTYTSAGLPTGNWNFYPLVKTTAMGGINYTKVLPSFVAKFALDDETYLKLGLAQVISRAPLDELKANRNISPIAPFSGSSGNPTLKPFEATQLDVSYEYYFQKDALFAVAGYLKNVSNYIGYDERTDIINGNSYTLVSPVNSDENGYISGIEFTYQTPFNMIKGLENFGIYSNLALVGSNIKEFVPVNEPLPMNGVAGTTGVLDIWYAKNGFDARLGAKYHSEYTAILGWNSSSLVRVKPETTLDFSASYALNDKSSVRVQLGNILDTPMTTYTDNKENRIGDINYFGRRLLVDFTYKF